MASAPALRSEVVGSEVVVLWGRRRGVFDSRDRGLRNLAIVSLTRAGWPGVEVATLFGVRPEHVSRLLRLADENGSAGLVPPMGRPAKLDDAGQRKAYVMSDEGRSGAEIAAESNMSAATVSRLLVRRAFFGQAGPVPARCRRRCRRGRPGNAEIADLHQQLSTARRRLTAAQAALKPIPAKLPANTINPDATRAWPRTEHRALQMVCRLLAYYAELDLARTSTPPSKTPTNTGPTAITRNFYTNPATSPTPPPASPSPSANPTPRNHPRRHPTHRPTQPEPTQTSPETTGPSPTKSRQNLDHRKPPLPEI